MRPKIKKNQDLGVYMVGKYKIGDYVELKDADSLHIEGFSEDGTEVYGTFFSDDCGGVAKFADIVGFSD